jgi:hypothetical protein
MNTLFKKLNFKEFKDILILNHPSDFQQHLDEMILFTTIYTEIKKLDKIDFVLSFITKQTEIGSIMEQLSTKLSSDAIVWFSYPKGTSKKYSCDFNRDRGWNSMGKYNFEPVRQVAIDEDWSAIRFRNVAHIKKITRNKNIYLSRIAKNRSQNKS